MKKFLSIIKYLALTSSTFLFVFAISHTAYADTRASHTCNDGGTVYATINISPRPASFSSQNPTAFTAYGQITSTCSARQMTLTAQNNNYDSPYSLIPSTLIDPGTYPQVPAQTPASPDPVASDFTSPSTANNYSVHFVLGVNEPDPINAKLTIKYGSHANPNNFTATLDNPIRKDIIITRVFSDGWSNSTCASGTSIASAQQNSPQTLSAGNSSLVFPSQSTNGNWSNVTNQSVYNYTIDPTGWYYVNGPTPGAQASKTLFNGEILKYYPFSQQAFIDTVEFDFPPCS